MTTSTQQRDRLRSLRQMLDDIRVDPDATGNLFVRAMDNFLTAAGYQDQALMRSALEEARSTVGDLVAGSVEDLTNRSAKARSLTRQFTEEYEGSLVEPDEQSDDLGRAMSTAVTQILSGLVGFRDGSLAMVRKHGVDVPNAAKLDEHIAYWQAVKANLVDCWPWTNAPLPPADREMIAASRAALQAGERGESLEAVIARRRSK